MESMAILIGNRFHVKLRIASPYILFKSNPLHISTCVRLFKSTRTNFSSHK